MTIASDLVAANTMLSADAAIMRAIVQGPATGGPSIVVLPTGQSVKTLSRIAAELTGGYLPLAGGTLSGTVKAPNYLIGNELASDAGTVGFTNTNGPALIFGGSASIFGGALIGTVAGAEVFRAHSAGLQIASPGKLFFGGTASTVPALKPVSASLQVRLADDSAFTTLEAASFIASKPTAWAIDTTPLAQTIANGATYNLPAGAGLVVLSCDSSGEIALFLVGGGVVTLVAQSGSIFVSGTPGSGKIGLEFSSGVYRINNNSGGSKLIGIGGIRSRAAA